MTNTTERGPKEGGNNRPNTRSVTSAAFQPTTQLARSPTGLPTTNPNLEENTSILAMATNQNNTNISEQKQNIQVDTQSQHMDMSDTNPNTMRRRKRQTTVPKTSLLTRRTRATGLRTPVTAERIDRTLAEYRADQIRNNDRFEQSIQQMLKTHLNSASSRLESFQTQNRKELYEFKETTMEMITSHQVENSQALKSTRFELNKAIENLSRQVSDIHLKQNQSPWHDSRWAFDTTGEHMPHLTCLPPTTTTTTVTTTTTGTLTSLGTGTQPTYSLPSLKTATPLSRGPPIQSRQLQFQTTPTYFDNTLPTPGPSGTTNIPTPIAPPQPAPRTALPNLLKIIKSWDLKYPGKLDATDFINEFEIRMLATAVNPNDVLQALSMVFSDHA
ncbi:integumentary mucin C.1-like [Leptopilina boulardi]|uniref:integumentary mucin C.1-like n=1 Tax=Leptopilina boulardi TaxID=63433 RepID=UPI0021F5C688|nr:integumentary mucin C.1-like [Leptopilina boulardi]